MIDLWGMQLQWNEKILRYLLFYQQLHFTSLLLFLSFFLKKKTASKLQASFFLCWKWKKRKPPAVWRETWPLEKKKHTQQEPYFVRIGIQLLIIIIFIIYIYNMAGMGLGPDLKVLLHLQQIQRPKDYWCFQRRGCFLLK